MYMYQLKRNYSFLERNWIILIVCVCCLKFPIVALIGKLSTVDFLMFILGLLLCIWITPRRPDIKWRVNESGIYAETYTFPPTKILIPWVDVAEFNRDRGCLVGVNGRDLIVFPHKIRLEKGFLDGVDQIISKYKHN